MSGQEREALKLAASQYKGPAIERRIFEAGWFAHKEATSFQASLTDRRRFVLRDDGTWRMPRENPPIVDEHSLLCVPAAAREEPQESEVEAVAAVIRNVWLTDAEGIASMETEASNIARDILSRLQRGAAMGQTEDVQAQELRAGDQIVVRVDQVLDAGDRVRYVGVEIGEPLAAREDTERPDSLSDFPEESLLALKDLVYPLEDLPQSDRLLRMIAKALEVKRGGVAGPASGDEATADISRDDSSHGLPGSFVGSTGGNRHIFSRVRELEGTLLELVRIHHRSHEGVAPSFRNCSVLTCQKVSAALAAREDTERPDGMEPGVGGVSSHSTARCGPKPVTRGKCAKGCDPGGTLQRLWRSEKTEWRDTEQEPKP